MPINKLPYKSLSELLRHKLVIEEDLNTISVIQKLKAAKKRGWLTREELALICRWKSPRAIRLVESNHSSTIRSVTKRALQTKSEREKMTLLISLKGVSIPMASAVLMLLNPSQYGVIDIRVWEVLSALKAVNTTPQGVNFRFNDWEKLLKILRYFATTHAVTVRNIEYSIFLVHQQYQKGSLYKNTERKCK